MEEKISEKSVSILSKLNFRAVFDLVPAYIVLCFAFFFIFTNFQITENNRPETTITAFLKSDVDSARMNQIVQHIRNFENIDNAFVITRNEASDYMQKEFGDQISEILSENPFPDAVRITFVEKNAQPEQIERAQSELAKMKDVDDIVVENIEKRKFHELYHVLLISILPYILLFIVIHRYFIYVQQQTQQRLVGQEADFVFSTKDTIFFHQISSFAAYILTILLSTSVLFFLYPEVNFNEIRPGIWIIPVILFIFGATSTYFASKRIPKQEK